MARLWARFFFRLVSIAGLAACISIAAASGAAAKYASIVIDMATGEVLYARNADTQNYPASLTKLMTLYLTFEALEAGRLSLDQKLPVSARAAGQAPTKLGLRAGESITVEDAVLALVTKSANDAAAVLAEALGGTEGEFAQLMTKKAREIGMSGTIFRNASGLPNKGQLSTARDMATLALALQWDFPQYYHYFSVEQYTFRSKTYRNHNRMLTDYAGTDGVKTGYTRASGFNIVVTVSRDGNRLVGVVFGGRTASSRDEHMALLLDKSFSRLQERAQLARATDADRPAQVLLAGATQRLEWSWGIQVGAYASITAATRALRLAEAKLARLLDPSEAALVPVDSEGRTLYRARYLGLSEEQAQAACRQLVGSEVPCVVVRNREGGPRLPVAES